MTTFNPWTSETLTRQSLKRANGYCPGIVTERSVQYSNGNRWTTQHLNKFGEDLIKGYGAGL